MSEREILERAIRKAIRGGLKIEWIAKNAFRVWGHQQDWLDDGTVSMEIICTDYEMSKPKQFIFNHDFAEALWGNKTPDAAGDFYYSGPDTTWQYHLQQMVIADDPIKYLAENIGS